MAILIARFVIDTVFNLLSDSIANNVRIKLRATYLENVYLNIIFAVKVLQLL